MEKLDSVRWFPHRRSGPRPRKPLPKKCRTGTTFEQNATLFRTCPLSGDLDL